MSVDLSGIARPTFACAVHMHVGSLPAKEFDTLRDTARSRLNQAFAWKISRYVCERNFSSQETIHTISISLCYDTFSVLKKFTEINCSL